MVDFNKLVKKRLCEECDSPIPAERIKALPDVKMCVKCATLHPEPVKFDAEEICAKPSLDARNGFAPGD